jgi:hypothetical protein
LNGSLVRVFVGAEPAQGLALDVLEHSIRKHTELEVSVEPLWRAVERSGIRIPRPKQRRNQPRTPFSFQRFAIPQLCDHAGRAIYLDSDMQVFSDIRELWDWPFDGADLLSVQEDPSSKRRSQFSVMVLDCASLGWDVRSLVEGLDVGRYSYEELIYGMVAARSPTASLPPRWNSLERYTKNETSLVHYTDMSRQPWLTVDNPLCGLWCEGLLDAIADGFVSREFVAQELRRGWVRPSLGYQVRCGLADPAGIPAEILREDRWFAMPHRMPRLLGRARQRGGELGRLAGVVGVGVGLVKGLRR